MTFARKLQYGAHDGDSGASFMALIEFTKKKGGVPSGFVMYYRIIDYAWPVRNRTMMLRLNATTAHEAEEFWPWGYGTRGKFPGFGSPLWEKTTRWLDRVALGCEGMWVRIGSPSPCGARRKKKLQFGNISHILHIKELQLKWLEEESGLSELQNELSSLEEEDEDECKYVPEENRGMHAQLSEELEKIQTELESAEAEIKATKAEMQYMVRQMFPVPLGKPRRRWLRMMTST